MNMIMCLSGVWTGVGVDMEKVGCEYDYVSGVWTGVGVEKVGRGYDYVFIWCLDRSWCGEGWEGI